jgi:hypothetical protein
VVAPDALNVDEPPEQIPVGLAAAVSVGPGVTFIVIVSVSVQFPLAPVTVYVVVMVGEAVTVPPLKLPGIQV